MRRKCMDIVWMIAQIYLVSFCGVKIYDMCNTGAPILHIVGYSLALILFFFLTFIIVLRDIVLEYRKKSKSRASLNTDCQSCIYCSLDAKTCYYGSKGNLIIASSKCPYRSEKSE